MSLSFWNSNSAWNVTASGDWSEDNKKGREYAREFIQFVRNNPNNTPMLGHIIRDMVKVDAAGGVEVGFCQAIAEALICPSE